MITKIAMKFTHLHVHTHFSLLDGLSKIDNLILRAKEYGMTSLAITDHGNMYGVIDFYDKCKKHGVKPIIGCELYVAKRKLDQKESHVDGRSYHLTALIKNDIGYKNLIKLVSIAHLEGFYYKPRIDKEVLKNHKEGIVFLSGCLKGEIASHIYNGNMEEAEKSLNEYVEILGKEDFYLELQHHPNHEGQKKVNDGLRVLAKKYNLKTVLTCDSHYVDLDDKDTHEVLLSIQTGSAVGENEKMSMKNLDLSLKDPSELYEYYKGEEEMLERTCEVADKCNFDFDFKTLNYPVVKIEGVTDNEKFLRDTLKEKMPSFYGKDDQEALSRIEYEMGVVKQTGYVDYILIV